MDRAGGHCGADIPNSPRPDIVRNRIESTRTKNNDRPQSQRSRIRGPRPQWKRAERACPRAPVATQTCSAPWQARTLSIDRLHHLDERMSCESASHTNRLSVLRCILITQLLDRVCIFEDSAKKLLVPLRSRRGGGCLLYIDNSSSS